jgi:hypothetical protein
MRLCRPDWYRTLVFALVFGLTCGTALPVFWAAPQTVSTSAPAEEEDEHAAKTAAFERRAVRQPDSEPAEPAPRPRCEPFPRSATSPVVVRPAAALCNGLSTHYRC